jgi:hypothetical protein
MFHAKGKFEKRQRDRDDHEAVLLVSLVANTSFEVFDEADLRHRHSSKH